MLGQPDNLLDKVFFVFAFLVMALVAANPNNFVKGVTLGRLTGPDVSPGLLRATQIIAGVAALSIAISFLVGLFVSH